MQCASLVNTIKPSLRKQRRKGYLFSTNLCFYAHFYRHAKLYLVYFLANFQTAGTSRRLGAPLVETPSSQFNRNTVYLTETGLIYDCVKVLMWKSLSCFYVCPCWNNDTVCFHCLKASRDKKDVFAQRDSACFGALIIRCSNCPATSSSKSNSLSKLKRLPVDSHHLQFIWVNRSCWPLGPPAGLCHHRLRIISAPCCVCIYVGEREAQKEKRPTTWAESWGSVLGCVTETFVCIMWRTLAPETLFKRSF